MSYTNDANFKLIIVSEPISVWADLTSSPKFSVDKWMKFESQVFTELKHHKLVFLVITNILFMKAEQTQITCQFGTL